MTAEPMTSATVPDYGEGTLPDLATSLLASLGVDDAPNPLGLVPARRACRLVRTTRRAVILGPSHSGGRRP